MIIVSGLTQKQMNDTVKGLHALDLKTEAKSGYNHELGVQTWTVYAFTLNSLITEQPDEEDPTKFPYQEA